MIWRWLKRQNYSNGNMVVHEWSCLSGRSVGGFQDLPRQFGRILTSKERNRRYILPVELAGSTLIKKQEK